MFDTYIHAGAAVYRDVARIEKLNAVARRGRRRQRFEQARNG